MTALTKKGAPRKRAYPAVRAKKTATTEARLALRIRKDGTTGCWLWTGYISPEGYGRLTIKGVNLYAHRLSYEVHVGPIPTDREIDHLCRNRACSNPEHLEAVTASENVRRGFSPGAIALRREYCIHGHAYRDHGVVRCGRRICNLCKRTYLRLYRALPYVEAMRRKHAGEPVIDLAAHFAAERQELARSA